MTDVDIRTATPADLDRLVVIETAAFESDRISRRSFRRQIASPTLRMFVASRAGRIDAYALVAHRRSTGHARLYSLAVDPAAGRGLGRALMAFCEADARQCNYTGMRLEVREENARAIAIYERAGYRLKGRRADYYEDGTAALLYEKDLT